MRTFELAARTLLSLALLTGCHHHTATQLADLDFEPPIPRPAFPEGRGPVIGIDEAHTNFHTADGRYSPFAGLLRRDGYVVQSLAEPASADSLARVEIYVVVNAIAASDEKGWKLPIEQAFTEDEIEAVRNWVEGGGALLLIADHMPFPGAVEDLAEVFDVHLGNGFAYDAAGESKLAYTRESGLADHPISQGRSASERVELVRTFTGQAFRGGPTVEPLLTLPAGSELRLPVEAWEFKPTTPKIPAGGMLQGAVLDYGEGRVAVFGEAAMFTAQSYERDGEIVQMGMNHPEATENPQFLLNTMHWLSSLVD